MQDIEKLAFVLVEPLHLNVKDRIRIYVHAVMLLNVLRQTNFILVFDIHKLLLCDCVVCIRCQTADLGQIGDPALADLIRHPFRQQWISVKKETSLGNTIRLIVEFLWHHLIKIFEFLILEDLRVELRHTVHGKTGSDR